MPDPTLPPFDPLWNYADPAGTETEFRALLPRAEAADDPAYLLELLTQIARCQGLQNNFPAAHATLDRVRHTLGARPGDPTLSRARVRYLLERGRALNSAGDSTAALPLFTQAAAVPHDPAAPASARHHVDALHMVAIAAPTPDEKIAWNLKALAAIDALPGQAGWRWSVYNNLAEAYLAAGRPADALLYFERIIALRRDAGHAPEWYMTKDLARCHRLLGDPSRALALLEPLAPAVAGDPESAAWLAEELGECLLALHRPADARPHFASALAFFSTHGWALRHDPARIAHLRARATS